MTPLALTQPTQLTKREFDLAQGLSDRVQAFPAQPVPYDPLRLGLAIGQFISALDHARLAEA